MNKREKEQYLREYYILKNQGKPFFPYAVLKDGAMACVVMLVIIVMAILLGAELGPKADPTTTSYTPRPEWYFFFLFELLRVIKPPAIVFVATIGVPTICMILLILLPFIDRNPERNPIKRPIALIAGLTTIAAMAYLTIEGARAGAPGQVSSIKVAPQFTPGKLVFAESGCQGCHRVGEDGNAGPGPNLTKIGARLPAAAIARTLINPTAPMPSFATLKLQHPQQFAALVAFLGSLK
jgi:ubiquinol-cytochrome c reductase cytochrome b subunit/menaquinol-cytochrome c reductase cytochrome b/c subunit